ncbi:MAG: class II fumarate hydratase [Candidatus Eisenbacteria bacterium]|nr:class II fumarate hydratase [Candidatus Eisenbacteria bacterium]
METRIERDSMGEMRVPVDALYGATTQRAVENFPISGRPLPRAFLRALGLIKKAAASVNQDLGAIDATLAQAIRQAADEVADGKLDAHFPIDVYQTGSGTSTNMNANEVIANRACQLLGAPIGSREKVHPNDHVNRGQSSNDVIPTALHVACAEEVRMRLIPALRRMHEALRQKSEDFDDVLKIGRTHLQDATPLRLGQVFGGFAAQLERSIERLEAVMPRLCELALGGTAVGTGINCPAGFAAKVIAKLEIETHLPFVEAGDHFEAQAARDAAVELSGALKSVAVSLYHIANNIRWLGSGPRCGIAEIRLPETQPGSSIMPGKVNPVIPEAMLQVSMRVIGNDAAVTMAGVSGVFELNVTIPLLADALLESIHLLSNASHVFVERCLTGLEADRERCAELIERSLMLCTALAPVVGYDKAAAIAKQAHKERKTVREVATEQGVQNLDTLLDIRSMT